MAAATPQSPQQTTGTRGSGTLGHIEEEGHEPVARYPGQPRSGTAVATILALCGGLALVYFFFVSLRAVDPAEAPVATVIAIALALIWLVGFIYRRITNADEAMSSRRDRERRGF